MKKFAQLTLLSTLTVVSFSCSKDDSSDPVTPPANEVIVLQNTINEDMTLSADKKYLLKGFVYVASGKTLTIQPGTVIKGDKDSKATLIVERGAKLMADGTVDKPIVFTSNMPKGQRAAGDWGGIIILGKGPENLPGSPVIEGGVDRPYGGTETNDNSGVLRYVRIEFPGIAFQPDNEINGLTMGGVGSGTTIDYVQVSYCGDDSYEWFGGNVNAKHLIAYNNVDDMFDTDNGFSGMIQYALGVSDPSNVADVSKSNGFESDNDASGSTNAPGTAPKFVNVSLFGPMKETSTTVNSNFGRGMHIRRNSHLEMHNGVIAGWPTGLLLDSEGSQNGAKVHHTVIAGSTDALKAAAPTTFEVSNWFNTIMPGNQVMANNADLQVPNAYNTSGRSYMPATGSPLLSGGMAVPGAEANTFRGAFGTSDWTLGWANWDPQNTDY